jgi:hypothetical protein
MASLRTGQFLARRLVRLPVASRVVPGCTQIPSAAPFQRRCVSQQSQSTVPLTEDPAKQSKPAPYEKGENVGEKRFSQFDLAGKVFVVTGAACRPPPHPIEQISPVRLS